jgi:uncharacterized membrane protein YhaH (DUF805 family)
MTFGESIRTCFTKYAEFNGRASRSEFWWFFLFIVLVSIALSVLSDTASALFSLGTLLPSFAVGARRLHDTNKSGWFQLFWIIPVIGWILLIVWTAQEGTEPNRFGATAA